MLTTLKAILAKNLAPPWSTVAYYILSPIVKWLEKKAELKIKRKVDEYKGSKKADEIEKAETPSDYLNTLNRK